MQVFIAGSTLDKSVQHSKLNWSELQMHTSQVVCLDFNKNKSITSKIGIHVRRTYTRWHTHTRKPLTILNFLVLKTADERPLVLFQSQANIMFNKAPVF